MKIDKVKSVCFSPTGTTKAIIKAIMQGINLKYSEIFDITNPEARKKIIESSENELLIIGVPVYMGRVPSLLSDWFNTFKAEKTPVVCVVVYGNRTFENAMLELKDIMTKSGCIPIAGAAFIGEHSFSSSDIPTAEGRPDANDLMDASQFGSKIIEKINSANSINEIKEIDIPGNYPYGGVTDLWSVDFITVSNECSHCGICAEGCPMGAIDSDNSSLVDIEKCITCCACIKNCPHNARTMKDSPVKNAAIRLSTIYKERKEPEYYF